MGAMMGAFDRMRAAEIMRLIGTFHRQIVYLEKELQTCAVVPPMARVARWNALMAKATATTAAATAEDPGPTGPINKRQELDDKIVKWLDAAEDERRALMLCTKRYLDLAESRVTRETVEQEIKRELAQLKK
jgi:hypothetical protein